MSATAPTFKKLMLETQLFVKNFYTKLRENPTDDSVAVTR
jgi:hypothetical protein